MKLEDTETMAPSADPAADIGGQAGLARVNTLMTPPEHPGWVIKKGTEMRAKKVVGGVVVALGIVSQLFLGAGSAQAAAGSDLDLTTCTIADDPIDYGDGIDWYKLHYTYKNEGSAPTGNFVSRARPVYGQDQFSGQVENEANLQYNESSMAPGQTRSGFYWVIKRVVDNRTWGIFLDVNKQTGESQTNDSFCSAFVNNT